MPEPPSPHQPLPKKLTRQQVIKQFLQQQAAETPPPERHQLEETTGYMKCVRCGCNVHKRCNEQTFQTFVDGPCLDREYVLPHGGHASHALWQKGPKVTCTHCGLSLHLDGQNRVILTGAIRKPCKGAANGGSPPLTEYFRSQPSQAAQQAPQPATEDPPPVHEASHTATHKSQDPAATQAATCGARPSSEGPHGRPTPRRLHFPTELDQQEERPAAAPLPVAQASTEPEDYMTVDCF